jgi:16S rRNA U516 pseudouridylate synthase RsuA-like enzyme
LRLIRYAIGLQTLDGLQPGEYKQVGEAVKDLLLNK